MAGVRKIDNWLKLYHNYTADTESPSIFHKWIGLSTIAAALQRKTWFNFGRIKIYPNLFILLVSDPGVCRKTQAISYAEDIILEIPNIRLAPDATTREALMDDLQSAREADVLLPNGELMTHNSLTIMSGEFETFLGNKKDNAPMIITLTDFFDCKAKPFLKRTKHSGDSKIDAVWLNLIAATTPESISQCFPVSAIGGGLLSRMISVWAGERTRKIPIPENPPDNIRIELIHDLAMIARISGGYNFTDESRKWWNDWYNKYDEQSSNRICKDPAFRAWYSRKPMFVIKVAHVLAASKTNNLFLEIPDLEEGLKYLEEVEYNMGKVFSSIGRSAITVDVDIILKLVCQYKYVSERVLKQLVWKDMDSRKFENVIETAIQTGKIVRIYRDPRDNTKSRIGYVWRSKESA